MASTAIRDRGQIPPVIQTVPSTPFDPKGPTGFEARREGLGLKQQMGGASGIAGGVLSGLTTVGAGATQIATAKANSETNVERRKMQAQGGINLAAGIAESAGPIGQAVGGGLKLISMLLNIKGPRQKRAERRARDKEQRRNEWGAKAAALGGAPALSATLGGGGAQMINNAPTAVTGADFGAINPTGKLLGL